MIKTTPLDKGGIERENPPNPLYQGGTLSQISIGYSILSRELMECTLFIKGA